MKKILEVFQYGDNDIRFNTDFSEKEMARMPEIIGRLAFTMTTKLWGGNEQGDERAQEKRRRSCFPSRIQSGKIRQLMQ